MAREQYRVLKAFESLFGGRIYNPRSSTQNNAICEAFFEDLYALGRSKQYRERCDKGTHAVNARSEIHGINVRHGDGTFGERVPSVEPRRMPGMFVPEGALSTLEIAVEVKVLSVALRKNQGNRLAELSHQLDAFKRAARVEHQRPLIAVALVFLNAAERFAAIEGHQASLKGGPPPRVTIADGTARKSPAQEVSQTEAFFARELPIVGYNYPLILKYRATNEEPYEFSWAGGDTTVADYSNVLTNVSLDYENLFR